MSTYRYGEAPTRTCACDREFHPPASAPDTDECSYCRERRAKRGRVIPPKALHEEELERAREARTRARTRALLAPRGTD